MNRNLIFAFLLLAALAMVNAVPYRLHKRERDIALPCSTDRSVIYANLNSFPPVSNQPDDYTVEGVMLDYEITAYKTEVIIVYADSNYNVIGNPYIKVLDFSYASEAPFSFDVSGVPTPQLPSAYAISVTIADKTDDPNKIEIHACAYANFGF
jgi:hypothetical protein